jgi:hypothetical protein
MSNENNTRPTDQRRPRASTQDILGSSSPRPVRIPKQMSDHAGKALKEPDRDEPIQEPPEFET